MGHGKKLVRVNLELINFMHDDHELPYHLLLGTTKPYWKECIQTLWIGEQKGKIVFKI